MIFTLIALALTCAPSWAERIVCSSTTSTQNSGLFDHILPIFTAKTGIEVHVVAVGTGAAIESGKRGDADVVFVHAKDMELKAVEEGYFVDRHDVMYNDFVIIGPKDDPSDLRKVKGAADGFKAVASSGKGFVSRGDKSGTHQKELAIWMLAGIDPQGAEWYIEVGQGMAKTQRIASEKRAYTLTDRGTWLSAMDKDELDMSIVLEGDPELFNQYGVMAVNPAKFGHVKYEAAMKFINWLVSKEGQEAIGSLKDAKGNQLFNPNAKQAN